MRTILVGLASVAGLLSSAPLAAAESVSVSDLGQPRAESTVPQPPVGVDVRGSCASVRTVDEANGGASACPAGTWPAPDGDWGPIVRVAAGDTLALTFEQPQTAVAASLTTRYPVGLMAPGAPTPPPGGTPSPPTPVLNFSPGAITSTATDDAHRWLLTLPAMDVRFSGVGGALAVVATGADGAARDIALAAVLPRPVDFGADCGPAFMSPTLTSTFCSVVLIKGPPPPTTGPTIAPPKPPTLRLRAALRLAHAKVKLPLQASERGKLRVKISAHGRHRVVQRTLRAGATTVTVALHRTETRATLTLSFTAAENGLPAPAITRIVRLPR